MFEYQLTPWRIEKCKCGHECCNSYYVVDKNSHPLTCDGRLKKDIAQLFAAAPELLNACKEAKTLLEMYGKNDLWGPEAVASIENIEEAIAKAEGKV